MPKQLVVWIWEDQEGAVLSGIVKKVLENLLKRVQDLQDKYFNFRVAIDHEDHNPDRFVDDLQALDHRAFPDAIFVDMRDARGVVEDERRGLKLLSAIRQLTKEKSFKLAPAIAVLSFYDLTYSIQKRATELGAGLICSKANFRSLQEDDAWNTKSEFLVRIIIDLERVLDQAVNFNLSKPQQIDEKTSKSIPAEAAGEIRKREEKRSDP